MPTFESHCSKAEEKIDESEQQDQEQEAGSASSVASFAAKRVDVSGEASVRLGLLLRDLNDIISPPERDDENLMIGNEGGLDEKDIANSNSHHQLPARKKKRQSTSPRSELLTRQFGDETSGEYVEDGTEVEDFIQSMCGDEAHLGQQPYLDEDGEEGQTKPPPPPPAFLSEDPFARVLSEAAAMVTNARPPPTFSVSRRDNEARLDNRDRERIRRLRLREAQELRRQMQYASSAASYSTDDYEDANDGTVKLSSGDEHSASASFASCCSEEYLSEEEEEEDDDLADDSDEEEEEESAPAPTRRVRRGPPLFDGSVANATPGNAGDAAAVAAQQAQAEAQGAA